MNLILDIGNTNVKAAIFNEKKWLRQYDFKLENFKNHLAQIEKEYPEISRTMLSNVGGLGTDDLGYLKDTYQVYQLGAKSKMPFKNEYTTPETLGADRLALAAAAYFAYPNKNVLVIDSGTCITYDFLSENGSYLGGAISPGMEIRYKAMHQFTANLPLLEANGTIDLIGNSTHDSMHSGVLYGMVGEIDWMINQYRARFQHLTVILTGGTAHFFAEKLKNTIFANSKFLVEGLNYLLEHNKS